MYSTCRVVGFLIKKNPLCFRRSRYRRRFNIVRSQMALRVALLFLKMDQKLTIFFTKRKWLFVVVVVVVFILSLVSIFFSHTSLTYPQGRTIRKVMGGRGGKFSSHRNFFSLSNSLYEFFFRPQNEYFLGLIGVHEFFHLIFLARIFFCTSPAQTPHKFSNGPSLNKSSFLRQCTCSYWPPICFESPGERHII